jgi:hypothetical protein
MYTAIFARSGILTPGLRQNRQWKTPEEAGTVPRTPFPAAEPIRLSSDLAVEALFSSLRMKVSTLTLTDSDSVCSQIKYERLFKPAHYCS